MSTRDLIVKTIFEKLQQARIVLICVPYTEI